MKMSNPSEKVAAAVELAQVRLATAENSVQTAKHESRAAKRRRKEAREAVRRAKKRLRRAKDELAEARCALADAREKLAYEARRAASQGKRLVARSSGKPQAPRSAEKITREPNTQDSESPVAATFLPVQPPAVIGPEALPEAPVITEEVPSPSQPTPTHQR
jgi:acyl-CoA reductase-like NAD-dependent aldehyde dehydrogenase